MHTMKHTPNLHRQQGLTLAELMVAMVISMMIVIATYASLTVARQGFGTVNATSELRDNARFAIAIIQQMATQAGYKNDYNATYMQSSSDATGFNLGGASETVQFVHGHNSAIITGKNIVTTGNTIVNSSDILTLRNMTGQLTEANNWTDRTMVDCTGTRRDASSMIESHFYVAISNGEPTLMCKFNMDANAEPLLSGVETFQVLYGVNTAADTNTFNDTVASFQFLRADEITNNAMWRQVRSLRIGMVLRSAPGSGGEKTAQDYWPLGKAIGDDNNKFTSEADDRMRQVVTFTVQLRNNLNPPNLNASL